MELGQASAILDAVADAVTIRARDNRLVYANRAALARLGMESLEELRAADPWRLLDPYTMLDEDGAPVDSDRLPSVRLLRGEDPQPLLLRYVEQVSGAEHWVVLKATALRGRDGEVTAAVTIIEDVTVSQRAARRLELLARASKILAASLDYEETLRNVASIAVPAIADWCAIDLFSADLTREPVAVTHRDPAKLELVERLRRLEAERIAEGGELRGWLAEVVSSGEAQLYADVTEDMLADYAADVEQLRLLRAIGLRSLLLVPMRVRERTIGVITFVSAESGRRFEAGDVELTAQLGARAALAVDNARLYSERSRIAATLQRSLLPEALAEVPGWEICALYRPAGHGGDVGGDFYDVWKAAGRWMLIVGDVTGKGIDAATLTSLARHTARTAAGYEPLPARVLEHVHRALRRDRANAVCTALCASLGTGGGKLAVGGHPLPLAVGAAGVREVGVPGTMLGAFPHVGVAECDFSLRPGEAIVAFTDGVTDARGAGGERFGAARLHETLAAVAGEPATAIRSAVAGALDSFQAGAQADDTAVVVLRYLG